MFLRKMVKLAFHVRVVIVFQRYILFLINNRIKYSIKWSKYDGVFEVDNTAFQQAHLSPGS